RRLRPARLPDRLAAGPGRGEPAVARRRRAPPAPERPARLPRGGPDPAGRGHPGQRLLRARGDLGDRADRIRDLPVPPGRPRAAQPPAPRWRWRAAPGPPPRPWGGGGRWGGRAGTPPPAVWGPYREGSRGRDGERTTVHRPAPGRPVGGRH